MGRVLITDVDKMNIPKPQEVGPLVGRAANADAVIILDSHTIMIKNFVYMGNQPGRTWNLS